LSDYSTIRYEVSEGLATLTINRPENFNGMTNRMLRETYDALSKAASDPSVKVLLLTGEGKSFCPGADLNAATSGGNRDVDRAGDPAAFRVPVLLHELPAVTIAAVNGACAGAGFGWACGCDIRVAARSAMFNTAFLNVAVAGDMGLPWSLPRLVGGAKARELSFFSEKFSADEAYRIGLVARVWDDEEFRGEVERMVERLLSSSPPAIRAMKAHYVAAENMRFGDYIDLETAHHSRIVVSEDTREAMRAFLEKRKPQFQGR
jgi:2-(1,2-epoxy-1,2-dihydrophenyl)acetyl-CoA isomerase